MPASTDPLTQNRNAAETMSSSRPFTDLTTAHDLGDGAYSATIDPIWTIGPKVHGGCMMAVCAAAAHRTIGDAVDLAPVALSANYISAPNPGEVQLTTKVRRRGRQVCLVDVELSQNSRTAVTCSVTLGSVDTKPPRHSEPLPVSQMPVQPSADAIPVSAEHPLAQILHVSQGCELAMDSATTGFLVGQRGAPISRMWVRPFASDEADPAVATLFAIMAGDIAPRVTVNCGIFGWTPTVQLTTYLRRRPAPGWMRVMASSTVIGDSWFEQDHVILDATGQVVVQSRQLAMLPEAAGASRRTAVDG